MVRIVLSFKGGGKSGGVGACSRVGQVYLTFKHLRCWATQKDRRVEPICSALPLDVKQTTVRVHINLRIQQAQSNACHHGRTSPRAAGQRFTRAAFINAQAHFPTGRNLHETSVDAAYKSRVVFYLWTPHQYWRCVDRLNDLHGMRVAHGHNC